MEKYHICISVGFLIELEIILYVEARIRNKSMYINHLRCYELSYFGTLCKFLCYYVQQHILLPNK